MPLVQIKLIEDELTEEESRELIEKVTDVMVSFSGEKLREVTWVVIEEVKSGHWGIGGKAVGLADVRAMQASED